MIASFAMDGGREVSYWIDPTRWGRGLASAPKTFLQIETTGPLFALVRAMVVGGGAVRGCG